MKWEDRQFKAVNGTLLTIKGVISQMDTEYFDIISQKWKKWRIYNVHVDPNISNQIGIIYGAPATKTKNLNLRWLYKHIVDRGPVEQDLPLELGDNGWERIIQPDFPEPPNYDNGMVGSVLTSDGNEPLLIAAIFREKTPEVRQRFEGHGQSRR